jgi:diguanylate cyclase (GGDEF)-like protein
MLHPQMNGADSPVWRERAKSARAAFGEPLRRAGSRGWFERTRDVALVVLTGVVGTTVSPTLGVVSVGTVTLLLIAAARSERRVADLLAHQANHDPLTGLPNRTLLLDRLEHALGRARRSKLKLAVVFLDLDDFKLVNDTRGHEVGDRLLMALTPRLTAALRPADTIARFGGDEFVVLCEDLSSEADAIEIAQRIANACSAPVVIGDQEHVVTVSAGVILVADPESATAAAVLREADAAMYRAKSRGKARVEAFDEPMPGRLIEMIATETEMIATETSLRRPDVRRHASQSRH